MNFTHKRLKDRDYVNSGINLSKIRFVYRAEMSTLSLKQQENRKREDKTFEFYR